MATDGNFGKVMEHSKKSWKIIKNGSKSVPYLDPKNGPFRIHLIWVLLTQPSMYISSAQLCMTNRVYVEIEMTTVLQGIN